MESITIRIKSITGLWLNKLIKPLFKVNCETNVLTGPGDCYWEREDKVGRENDLFPASLSGLGLNGRRVLNGSSGTHHARDAARKLHVAIAKMHINI